MNDAGSLLGACLGGAGIARLLEVYARPIIAEGRLIHLLPEWSDETFSLYAYHHGASIMPEKINDFLPIIHRQRHTGHYVVGKRVKHVTHRPQLVNRQVKIYIT